MSLTPARLIKVHKEFNSHCSLIQVCVFKTDDVGQVQPK